jgi:glycosyltransferase involved in cell wall biosynthesis
VPCFNEAANLEALFERLLPVLRGLDARWEVVCVNDGSTDATLARLVALHAREPNIRVIDLSRNFGKEAALSAGLLYAQGDAVVPMDSDLQHPPEIIPALIAKWREGYEIVAARRHARVGQNFSGRLASRLFYWLFNRLSEVPLDPEFGDFRLLDRVAVDTLNSLPERTRFMKGLFAWAGFSTTTIYYDRPERFAGTTSWNYLKLWSFALDGLFTFSTKPLKVWTYLGGIISVFAFLYGAFILLNTLLYGRDIPGYTSIMVVILFLGGVQLMSLGIIGEYIGRIYRETKQRPLYIIEEKEGF